MRPGRLILSIMLMLLSSVAGAQYFTFGADPSSVKWSSIKTSDFKLIYPRGMDSLARTYLFNLERYRKVVNESLLIDTKSIPVVLHPYTVMSNGCVSWTPKVVNLITSPDPYDSTPEPWIEQLAVHEMRHVGQTEQFTRGFFGPWYWLIGEQAAGVGVGLCAASTFLEGDAVLAETQFSQAGRGRNARFLMYQRALYLDGDWWGWDRSAFGSYRYKSVNQYALGYALLSSQLLTKGDFNYSGTFFKDKARLYDVTKYLEKRHLRRYPSKDSMMALSYRFWGTMWDADVASRGASTSAKRISGDESHYCEYTDPIPLPDGAVLARRQGLQYAGDIVRVDAGGRTSTLHAHSQRSSKLSSSASGRVYWSETTMHNPATLEMFSEIRSLDPATGNEAWLTHGTKFFNPDVSADGSRVAVAEYPVEGSSKLVVLSASDGSVQASYPAPDNGQILEPCFFGDSIYATSVGSDGVGIYRFDASGNWDVVVPQQHCEIRHLRSCVDGICFSSDLDGLLNIYMYEPESGSLRKLTNSLHGADYPCYDSERKVLYYSDFDSRGFHIVKAPADSLLWEDAEFSEACLHPVAEMLTANAEINAETSPAGDMSYFDDEKYPSRKYNKFLNSFHIHSWAPIYYNVDRIMDFSMDHYYDLASLGAAVYSQNELGTVVTMLGYSYHGGFHSAHGKITAILSDIEVEASLDVNDRKQMLVRPCELDGNGNRISSYTTTPNVKFSIMADYPLNLYGAGSLSMFIPYISIKGTNDILRFADSAEAADFPSMSIQAGARYYRMRPTAKAAVFPRSGFSVTGAFDAPLLDGGHYTSLAVMNGYCYAPGLTRSQGFKFSWSLQRQFGGTSKVLSKPLTSLPRGYVTPVMTTDYAKVGLDYAFPVWLGDVSLGKLLYLKRLEITAFADAARDRSFTGKCSNYGSTGADFLFRFNALRIGFEMNAGLRCALTMEGQTYFGPLFGISIK